MAHELRPRTGSLPPAAEVARRLAVVFPWVRSDPQAGTKSALARAARIERAPAAIFGAHHSDALEHAKRLRSLAPGEALVIEIGEEFGRKLQFVLVPGEQIQFGYGSREEELASRSLVDRCADALDCDVVVI